MPTQNLKRRLKVATLLAGFSLAATHPATAADGKYALDFSPARAEASERLLDGLEYAFSEMLGGPASNDLRLAATRLVNARAQHAEQFAKAERTAASVEEAKARLERDRRLIEERRASSAWAALGAGEQADMRSKEEDYLERIRGVARNRAQETERLSATAKQVENLLAMYALSWGDLAFERAIVSPTAIVRLSGGSWRNAMDKHAVRFNAYVAENFVVGDLEGPALRPLRAREVAPTPVFAEPSPGRGLAAAPGPGPASGLRPSVEPVFPSTVHAGGAAEAPVAPMAPMAPRGAVETHGGFRWYLSFEDAAADARRTGKAIFCLSTKPDCCMCEDVRDKSVPQNLAAMGETSVGYIYQIGDPEDRAVDRVLRANLKGATLMPLAGWVTSERAWIHGFHGARSGAEFGADLRVIRARRR